MADLKWGYWSLRRFNSRASPLQKLFVISLLITILGVGFSGIRILLWTGILMLMIYLTYFILWYREAAM